VGNDQQMRTETITVTTGRQPGVYDVTGACHQFVADSGDGWLNVFVPHATAGVAIIELGSGTEQDLLTALDKQLPRDDRWMHQHGSRGHGRDHVLPAFIAPSITVPVATGVLLLGTWQSICLVDTNVDNPTRTVRLSFLA
jgi:secondary thiamine-phosphate synthase enzyme